MTEFITARYPENEMPKTQDRKEMFRRVGDFLKGLGRLREAGGEWGPWRQRGDVLDRVDRRTSRMGVGPKLIVQRKSDKEQLSIREVDLGPLIPDLGAAPEIEKIHGAVWDEFDVRSGGLYLCRFIDGTKTVSKHGYLKEDPNGWRGAAEDIFVINGSMTDLVHVAEFVVNGTKNNVLDAATVIVDRKIWTPAAGWHAYTGDQHFHVHADVLGGHACVT
jgi:hypothetical protein